MSTLFDEAQYLLREAYKTERINARLEWEMSVDAESEMMRDKNWLIEASSADRRLYGIPYRINPSMVGKSIVLLRPIR